MRNTKKVITWGIRYSDYGSQRELFSLVANKRISITAETEYNEDDEQIFFCRKSLTDAFKEPHDLIVTSSMDELINARAKLIREDLTDETRYLTTVGELVSPYREEQLRKQEKIVDTLVNASDDMVSSREWMKEQINSYGFFPFFKLVKKPEPGVIWSTIGILQVPDEFTDLCMRIGKLKCNNAIEIGVASGSSSYIMAALMYRNNHNLRYDMVDICDSLVNYDEIKQQIPALNKCIPTTSNDYIGKVYDFCFIDADHSYTGMMTDHINVGQYTSKITVFHDIFGHEYDHLDGGTVRGWQEIKESVNAKPESIEKIIEYSSYPGKWMGLGVIIKN